jgi:hypothetical protein
MSDFWKEFDDSLSLTADDKGAIRELLGSVGWRVLTHKVFPRQERRLLEGKQVLDTKEQSSTWSAGVYAGLQLAQSLPKKLVRDTPDQPESQKGRNRKVHLQREFARGSKPM